MNDDLHALAAVAIDEILSANAVIPRQSGDFTIAEFAERAGWTFSHAQRVLIAEVQAGRLRREQRYDHATHRHVWAFWKEEQNA